MQIVLYPFRERMREGGGKREKERIKLTKINGINIVLVSTERAITAVCLNNNTSQLIRRCQR